MYVNLTGSVPSPPVWSSSEVRLRKAKANVSFSVYLSVREGSTRVICKVSSLPNMDIQLNQGHDTLNYLCQYITKLDTVFRFLLNQTKPSVQPNSTSEVAPSTPLKQSTTLCRFTRLDLWVIKESKVAVGDTLSIGVRIYLEK